MRQAAGADGSIARAMSGYRILGDWGSTRLRLFRVAGGVVTDRREGPGIASLDAAPAAILREAIAPWRQAGPPRSITLCGMVGSRNGLLEIPYVDCPANETEWLAKAARVPFDDGMVTIMAGLAGHTASGAPDVLRGEETQLFGAIARDPTLGQGSRLVALPGTHSKWVRIQDGRVAGFQTFLTGEIFALLRDHSLLTRVAGQGVAGPDDEDAGFAHGLARARAGQLLGGLFEARSAQLRLGRSPAWALGYLSGLLLGREIAEAVDRDADAPITLIGDTRLTSRYARALEARGLACVRLDGDACVLAGLDLVEAA